MAQYYELVIYTDQLPTYADPILDRLDPQRFIQYRLYRDSTQYINGKHVGLPSARLLCEIKPYCMLLSSSPVRSPPLLCLQVCQSVLPLCAGESHSKCKYQSVIPGRTQFSRLSGVSLSAMLLSAAE